MLFRLSACSQIGHRSQSLRHPDIHVNRNAPRSVQCPIPDRKTNDPWSGLSLMFISWLHVTPRPPPLSRKYYYVRGNLSCFLLSVQGENVPPPPPSPPGHRLAHPRGVQSCRASVLNYPQQVVFWELPLDKTALIHTIDLKGL